MKWLQLRSASLSQIIDWAAKQPWGLAMASCIQDPEWHAEGDVWTHTLRVLEQLVLLPEWPSLSKEDQTLLIFTALFHDVAKPLTTEVDPETGRVRSPKHAVKGEQVARCVLRELGCDLLTREAIAKLVRYHGRPIFVPDRDDPIAEVVRLSWLVNNRLLYLFALADTRGRDTDSMSRPEESLHYFKLMAIEANCFEQPYPFATEHARFIYFRQLNPNLHYQPHEDFSCTVTVMSGFPGAGKNTWLEKHRKATPSIALDDLREELDIAPTDNQGAVAQLARERCREHLRAGESFAFNATNLLRMTRSRWLDLFANYRARIEIVYVEPEFDQIKRQNLGRVEAVPMSVIERLAEKCEPPTWLECHALTISSGV